MNISHTVVNRHDGELLSLIKTLQLSTGELYYHSSEHSSVYKSSHKDITEEFWNLLTPESHNEILAQSYKEVKAVAEQIRQSYKLKLQNNVNEVAQAIQLFSSRIISKVNIENSLLEMKLNELQRLFDSNVMQLVLQYYAILKSEIDTTRVNLENERKDKQILIRQATLLRDIRLYACHLTVESRGTINISLLSQDSQQYIRCVKAVTDNVNGTYFGMTSSKAEAIKRQLCVRNVLKLQNAYLSGKLKASSEKVSNGKVKGLFCCLSAAQFYRFAALGLFAQRLSPACRSNAPTAADIASSIFNTPWFCAPPPLGVPVNRDVTNVSKVCGTALKLATSPPGTNESGVIRFSRYSTISNITDFDHDQLEQGVFLSLCRVLIVHQRSIPGPITDKEVVESTAGNYDALYSTSTEEYVLLQPAFVLPEFFMHVQFPDAFRDQAAVAASPKVEAVDGQQRTSHVCAVPPELQVTLNQRGSCADLNSQPSSLDIVCKYASISEIMLQNAMNCNMKTRSDNRDSSDDDHTRNDNGDSSPRSTLMRKQNIVLQLQESVQAFHSQAAELMRRHADKIGESVNLGKHSS